MHDHHSTAEGSRHYFPTDLDETLTTILNALRLTGEKLDSLTPDGLAPVGQLHTGGKLATR